MWSPLTPLDSWSSKYCRLWKQYIRISSSKYSTQHWVVKIIFYFLAILVVMYFHFKYPWRLIKLDNISYTITQWISSLEECSFICFAYFYKYAFLLLPIFSNWMTIYPFLCNLAINFMTNIYNKYYWIRKAYS